MTKLCLLADTRMRHGWLRVPRAALTVHAGNYARRGTLEESAAFLAWFGALPGMKVLVTGSADRAARESPREHAALCSEHGVVHLDHERATVAGLRVWGGSTAPEHPTTSVDLLVTHASPFGIGDPRAARASAESLVLLRRVHELKPKVHVFCSPRAEPGCHRHEAMDTVFVNAATGTLRALVRGALTYDLDSSSAPRYEETASARFARSGELSER